MSQFNANPMPPQPGPFPSKPPKKPMSKEARIGWQIFAGLAVFVLGVVIGAAPSSNATDAATYATTHPIVTPTVTETVPGPAGATVTAPPVTKTVVKPGPTVKVTEKPAEAAATIDEGTWEVGVDVAPGRYKTTAAVEAGGMCYWKITTTGKPDNIVDNDIVTGGRPTVTIKKGQDFTTQDCGIWTKVG